MFSDYRALTLNGDVWGAGAPDRTYSFVLPAAQRLVVNACAANFDTLLSLSTDPNGFPGTVVDFSDDAGFCGTASSGFVTGTLSAGTTYYLTVDGYDVSDAGPVTLSFSNLAPVAVVTPSVVPVNEVEPNNDDAYFTQANDLGAVPSNGQVIGLGNVNYYLDDVDT